MKARVLTALIVAAAALVPGAGQASGQASDLERPRWHVKVLAKVDSPGYPAYVFAHPNGRVYAGTFTNPAGDGKPSVIREWTRAGRLLRQWTVPGQDLAAAHGAQVATADARGRLVVLDRGSGRVLRLNLRTGRFSLYARIPDLPACPAAGPCTPNLRDDAPVPNYAAWGPRGALYVSDYAQAVIWRVRPGGGHVRAWHTDRRLDGAAFGTAGLALAPDHRSLLLTQQTSLGGGDAAGPAGTLYRLGLGKGRKLEPLWRSRPMDLPDGFGIARSGRVYVACAGSNQIVVLDRTYAEVERVPAVPAAGSNGSPTPYDTPSNATFAGRSILVANQAFLGDTSHHAILDVYVGERGVPTYIPDSAGVRR